MSQLVSGSLQIIQTLFIAGMFWWQAGQTNTVFGAQQANGLLFFLMVFVSIRVSPLTKTEEEGWLLWTIFFLCMLLSLSIEILNLHLSPLCPFPCCSDRPTSHWNFHSDAQSLVYCQSLLNLPSCADNDGRSVCLSPRVQDDPERESVGNVPDLLLLSVQNTFR